MPSLKSRNDQASSEPSSFRMVVVVPASLLYLRPVGRPIGYGKLPRELHELYSRLVVAMCLTRFLSRAQILGGSRATRTVSARLLH